MQYQIKLLYSDKLIQRAVFAFCRKSFGWRFIFAIAMLSVWVQRMMVSDKLNWIQGAILAFFIGYALLYPLAYLNHYRHAMQKLRSMGEPEATLTVDALSVTYSSKIGTMTMPWNAIKQIWQFDEFWLFVYYNGSFSTIPTAKLFAEERQFMVACLKAHDGKAHQF